MTIEDTYRYMISAYFGVREMDSYDLKEYVLKDIKEYIDDFVKQNPSPNFDFEKETEKIKDETPLKTKLQDALSLLNKMDNAPIELTLQISQRLKKL